MIKFLVHVRLLLILALITTEFSFSMAQSPSVAVELSCEHLQNPIGIDTSAPRLSWRLDDKRQGAKQSSYRILVATDSAELGKGNGNIWDSKWISAESNLVTFDGQSLTAFTKYFWSVEVTDHSNVKSSPSKIATFETGMMQSNNWRGAWITDENDINVKAAPYFRKSFETKKVIRSARAYIAVGGLYELSINGKRVGDHRLDPTYTRFDRRTLYVTYDVTDHISHGKNAIGVLLGNGWYNHQSTAVWNFHHANWRARPTFCLDLRITYEDGSIEIVSSGRDWKTSLSPVIFNSIYTAEHYDARLEQEHWNTPDFDDSKWKGIVYRSAPSLNIVSQVMHPIRNVETMKPVSVKKFNDTTYVYDLGRNISGVIKISVHGETGTVIRMKHGERLHKNGHVDMSNIDVHYRPTGTDDPFQTDIFILNGNGEETFMPRFNYKGFQYVEVTSSMPVSLTKESITGYFMHSDVPVVGKVRSSNSVMDKIWEATNNSYLSNLFGYPTDCPQREKNGWTGDASIAIETGLYSFDGITIYEKWLADHRDEQQPNGVLPSIIPTSGWGYEWGNGPDWTSTIAIIPWNIYLFYGDKKLLSDCYENIKRYVDHIDAVYPSGLTSWGLGDWVPVKSVSPVELTSTCYYFADATILAKAARILDKENDYEKYSALADKIKNAFNSKYLNRETALYGSGLQTELSVPLYWGLVPEELKSKVATNLAARVEADQFHLDVGLLGQKAILNALSENGYADIAYKVASQETYPSWGWWIKNGATTLYENWNIDSQNDISLNHIMFGEIGAWMYKGIAGIFPDPFSPGFKNIIFKPHFVKGLDHFEGTHRGPYGDIVSSWARTRKGVNYTVTIPPNSTGTVQLPVLNKLKPYLNGKVITTSEYIVNAGTYHFDWK